MQTTHKQHFQQEKEWGFWIYQIGKGTTEQQINALKCEEKSYQHLLKIEEVLRLR